MSPIEPLEDRRHFAVTRPDPSFGELGRVELPAISATADAVLAVGRSIYVAASAERTEGGTGQRGVFKFDDRGRLDTTWGRDGFAVYSDVNAPVKRVTQLAYDKRTGSLWAAGSVIYGGTDGGALVSEVGIGRFDSAGRSTIDYPFTRPQYGVLEQRLTFAKIVPLPHNKAVVLFDREAERSTGGGDGDNASEDRLAREVVLMKLGVNGQRDATFGRRGLRTVLQGEAVTFYRSRSETVVSDIPTGRDVQTRPDGSFRVIDTRQRGTARYTTRISRGLHTGGSLDSTVLVDSSVVTADGTVRADGRQVWRAAYTTGVSRTQNDVPDFVPRLVEADGDGDGVLVVGGRSDTSQVYLRLTPGVRPPATPLPGVQGTPVRGVQRDAFGVLLAVGQDTITELSPRLKVNAAFAGGGTAVIDDLDAYTGVGLAATDASGRVLVVSTTVSSTTGVPVLRRYSVR